MWYTVLVFVAGMIAGLFLVGIIDFSFEAVFDTRERRENGYEEKSPAGDAIAGQRPEEPKAP